MRRGEEACLLYRYYLLRARVQNAFERFYNKGSHSQKIPKRFIEGFYSTETLINPVELNDCEGGLRNQRYLESTSKKKKKKKKPLIQLECILRRIFSTAEITGAALIAKVAGDLLFLHVFPSAINDKPTGQTHSWPTEAFTTQKWLQPPLFVAQELET